MSDQIKTQLLEYYVNQPDVGENPEILDFASLSSGWASDVYAFTLRYEEAGQSVRQRLVLKTFTDNMDGIDRALKERHALFNLRSARYPVPGVSRVETDAVHIGKPFIVMEQVEGHLLADLLETADESERHALVELFVGLMTQLHSLSAKVLVPSLQPVSEFALVNREVHTLRGLVQQYGLTELAPLVDWLYTNRKSVPSPEPVITHRDFHPWNILLTSSGVPYVIDWGWQLSDARYDLAWTLTLLERSGFGTLRDAILAEYERVTGGVVQQLSYFEVLATTHWLFNITHSIRTGDALREGAAATFRTAMVEPVHQAFKLLTTRTGVALPEVEVWLQA